MVQSYFTIGLLERHGVSWREVGWRIRVIGSRESCTYCLFRYRHTRRAKETELQELGFFRFWNAVNPNEEASRGVLPVAAFCRRRRQGACSVRGQRGHKRRPSCCTVTAPRMATLEGFATPTTQRTHSQGAPSMHNCLPRCMGVD